MVIIFGLWDLNMKYEDYRTQIKSGDLLAWSHRGIKSFYDFKIWLIRLFTQSEYTHVGVAWVYGGRVFILESVTPYPRIVPLSNELPCYLITTNKEWNPEAEEAALKLIGNKAAEYSQWEAIKGYLGKNTYTRIQMCVEYAKYVLGFLGVTFKERDTPSDMVLEAQKFPNSRTVYLE
jgi:hypothetical protein